MILPKLRQLLASPFLIWTVLALPLAVLVFRYANGATFYGGFILDTGRMAAWLLLLTLAIAPLQLTFRRPWTRWLLGHRRYFGVAVFGYAAAHTMAYLLRTETVERWLEDGAGADMWTGWLALIVFLPLAITSNDWCVRRLRRAWKPLHRLVHVGAILTFAHWALSAFDPFLACLHLAALALIESWRLLMAFFLRRKRAA